MLPYLSHKVPWFVWLAHMRDRDDIARGPAGRFLRHFSADDEACEAKVTSMLPLVLGELSFGSTRCCGEVVSVMKMPHQMMRPEGALAVRQGLALSVQRGAKTVGLGGLTSSASGSGLRLLRHLPSDVVLTNGNAYTAVVTVQNVRDACRLLDKADTACVAIVGCTGSVGSAVSRLLDDEGFELILVGRNVERVRKVLSGLGNRNQFTGDMAALREADVVVLLTSDPSATLEPRHVSKTTIVIDCSQPANIPKHAYPSFLKIGVVPAVGGQVSIPNHSSPDFLGFRDRRFTFACLAETYLFSRAGIRQNSVGRPGIEFCRKMAALADEFKVTVPPLNVNLHRDILSIT